MPSVMPSLVMATLAMCAFLARPTSALDDKQVLSHFYSNADGPNWTRGWDTDEDDVCSESYPGVSCDSNGHVSEIDLSDNNLSGSISPHVYTLKGLTRLDVSKNRITNAGWNRIEVVENMGNSVSDSIEVIKLTDNLVNSVEGLGKLNASLKELHMTYNNLKGTMPSEFFELPKLEVLAMSENALDGTIDTRIGKMDSLLELYCYGNKITGTIPGEIGELNKIQLVTFAENQLTGPLPDEIRHMGNLRTFSVHNNDAGTGSHTGPLPKFDRHPFLNEIYLDGNAFTGTIPVDFLRRLNTTNDDAITVGLKNNQLTGTVPESFLKFKNLQLDVTGNSISGFGGDMCDEQDSRDISSWMGGKVELFGCDAILCPDGYYTDTGRQESEDVKCKVCDAGTDGKMGATDCESDTVTTSEELQILAEFYLALGGKKWDEGSGWEEMSDIENPADVTLPTFTDNGVDGCKFQGVSCQDGSVVGISLPNNGLEGIVPDSFWTLPKLAEVDLSGNEVQLDRDYGFGNIGDAKSLVKADLSSNDIQSFNGIGAATSLKELYLDDSYFFGPMADELFDLAGLRVLHMQFSGVKGSIPEKLGQLQEMKNLNLYGNEMVGSIPAVIGELPILWHLDLSENDFTGELPVAAFAKLKKLAKFHIHQTGRGGAGITGKLPSFAENTELHLLDLSSNTMTGTIPTDFLSGVKGDRFEMEVDISFNGFTGTVPAELNRFSKMKLTAIRTEITKVDEALCEMRDWWNGEVGLVADSDRDESGCDAILCPKGTYNKFGRAKSGPGGRCLDCPGGEYAGQTTCDGTEDTDDNVDYNKDKKILDKLYVETGGKNWTGADAWGRGGAVCTYEGVTCVTNDGTNGNEDVKSVNLTGFGLVNTIPSEIWQLSSLESVYFSDNVVDLSFEDISQAKKIKHIAISSADVHSLKGISGAPETLKTLRLQRNKLDSIDELYEVKSLTHLNLGFSSIDGTLSTKIGQLSNLVHLKMEQNKLTGTIPTEISKLQSLELLTLSGNSMSGTVPEELDQIATLTELYLDSQQEFGGFSGPVPAFSTAQLKTLDLSRNSLTGSIPNNFYEAVRNSGDHDVYAYDTIDLSSNQITGDIPENFDDFVGIFINLANNKISGVPGDLCDDDDEFMNGMVGELEENKCDAILCPAGTSLPLGRQVDKDVVCQPCPGDTAAERKTQAPYFGSIRCKGISKDRVILEKLWNMIFTDASEDRNWGSVESVCTWYGITCDPDGDEDSVTEVKLENNQLRADDPEAASQLFGELPSLKKLNIRGNSQLPLVLDLMKNLPNLELLQLSNTGLTTMSGIGEASSLEEFHVTQNDISGTIPDELYGLVQMERLYLSFNSFNGTISTKIGQLAALTEFYAYTNELSGELPTELGDLTFLENFVVGKNKLEGKLPSQINDLANLKELSVFYNEGMTGPILPFSEATALEKLDLEGCQFTGSIPSSFLSGLDADFKSDNEVIIHLSDNAFTGELPSSLGDIDTLYLGIAGNHFEGPLPASFCDKSDWMNGQVGLVGSCDAIACPAGTYNYDGYASRSTKLSCNPCGGLETAPFLGSYSCSKAALEITALKQLYEATAGSQWDTSDNWMEYDKPICSWHGVICDGGPDANNTIVEINLGDNYLDGTFPSSMFELPHLERLNLKNNKVFMKFNDIYKAKKLELLYLSSIDIGSIEGLGRAPALRELHLTSNEITGSIPNDFYDLFDTLENLYIAYNSFSGRLDKFAGFSKLVNFYAYNNEFSGTIPDGMGKLSNLQHFVFAENKLSGTIPLGFSSLPSLKLLSLYRRIKSGPKLTGPLPPFNNNPSLEGLYLDYNHLSGTIPADFLEASLNTKLITISHNRLTGEIPLTLDSFDALNIEMEGNLIDRMDVRFCDNVEWMDGKVKDFGCNAILCPKHTYGTFGRQNGTDSNGTDSKCTPCANEVDSTPYLGSTTCDVPINERDVLDIFYNALGGDNWDNNEGWKSDKSICDWFGVECRDGTSVQAIRLGANNLKGTPPKEIFLLRQLHILWLHSNPIEFDFDGIDRALNLVDLRLDATGLSDVYGVQNAKQLRVLNLNYNQISGSFPTELLGLERLETLSMVDNDMSGNLPSFDKMKGLITLRLGSNRFSGAVPTFVSSRYITHLDLSDNELSGAIPDNLLDEVSLRKPMTIDLSSNKLTGGVPLRFDRFDDLTLYVRDNKITDLPPALCDADNKRWNLRDVTFYGCDGIMCPPGTASYRGRQSDQGSPCERCSSNRDLYGQVSCDGVALGSSSGARRKSRLALFVGSLVAGLLLLQ